MDNQLLTLSKIFTERLFRIPDYQRGYAWSDKQLREFWADIEQLDPQRNHYTGVLTLELVPEKTHQSWRDDKWIISSKSYDPYYIVDGQQRITTSLILIQCILDHSIGVEKLNYTHKDDIIRKFIYDSKGGDISRSYIFGYEDNNPSFHYLKEKIFGDRVSGNFEDTIYTQNLENAKSFFNERLDGLGLIDLELIFRKLTQSLLFNIFTISDDVDVCVAFETMNNRGKPLSYLELLKNRLIYLTTRLDDTKQEIDALRKAINDTWKTIYHNLGKNKYRPLNDDQFLWTHFVVYFGKYDDAEERGSFVRRQAGDNFASELLEGIFTAKNLVEDSENYQKITKKYIYDYVTSLEDSILTWYDVFNPFQSKFDRDVQIFLDKLDRIGSNPFLPLILVFLQQVSSPREQVKFLKQVERYLFVTALTNRYYYEADVFHVGGLPIDAALRLLSANASAKDITAELKDRVDTIVSHASFYDSVEEFFRDKRFYGWKAVRYFLFEYNLSLQEKSKTERGKIYWPEFVENRSDYITVEHIFPKNARHRYWRDRFGHLSTEKRLKVRDSLGNLLPLSKPKNSSLSNKPFPDKVDGNLEGAIGYRYGSYAENEVASSDEWTPDHIRERGLKMIKFLESRWDIDFGDDRRRRKILGF